MTKRALLVEDNTSHAELISEELETALEGWCLDIAPTLAEARRKIASAKYDLFVFDYRLPDGDGISLLREVRTSDQQTPALFVTTASSAKLAVDAMKVGADDYVVKEEGYLTVLPYLVQEVLRRRQLDEVNRKLEERLQRAERAATVGYLASGLAHHINNPLATIRTFLQLLPTRYDDPEFREEYLATALSESERIRDLVKDIMRATTVPVEGKRCRISPRSSHGPREAWTARCKPSTSCGGRGFRISYLPSGSTERRRCACSLPCFRTPCASRERARRSKSAARSTRKPDVS